MCGKFTAMASWREVWEFSQLIPGKPASVANDSVVTYRVMQDLPVIVFDHDAKQRRIIPMRWGFPHRTNHQRPDPIHARSETIDEKPTFRDAFLNGQRGIVVMQTFNEGLELPNGKTEQHVVNPGDDRPRGFAFLWKRYDLPGNPVPLFACVMVTVPANKLISSISDRMPAILGDDEWSAWLGEVPAHPLELKAMLRTKEGLNWKMDKDKR